MPPSVTRATKPACGSSTDSAHERQAAASSKGAGCHWQPVMRTEARASLATVGTGCGVRAWIIKPTISAVSPRSIPDPTRTLSHNEPGLSSCGSPLGLIPPSPKNSPDGPHPAPPGPLPNPIVITSSLQGLVVDTIQRL